LLRAAVVYIGGEQAAAGVDYLTSSSPVMPSSAWSPTVQIIP
jgi:hypothetical protein